MKNLCAFFIALGGIFVLGPQVFAHEAHQHGHAYMNVSVEGKKVEIELVSPLANVISFEHAPETDAQKKEVRDMAAVMRKAETLFLLPAEAGCQVVEVSLESSVIDDDLLASGEAGKTHAHHEGHKHEAEEHDGHDHGHGHADLEVEVSFMCRHPEKLRGVTVDLFRAFPNLHEIEVQMVTPGGQKAAELTPESNTLRW